MYWFRFRIDGNWFAMKNKPENCQILQIGTDNISFIFDLQIINENENNNLFLWI